MTDTQLLPVIWTLGSMVIYVLTTLFIGRDRAANLRITTGGRVAEQTGRLVFYVGLPYVALLTQSLAPFDMGLAGNSGGFLGWSSTAWLHALNDTLIIGAFTLIPMVWVARQLAHTGRPLGVDERSLAAIAIDSAYAEIHWAFYRAAPLIILNDVYWGTLFGLALVGVELLVTLIHSGLGREPEERQSWLGQVLLLAMSAALFILTRNVWLLIALHILIEIVLKLVSTRLAAHAISAPPLSEGAPVDLPYDAPDDAIA